MEDWTGGIPSQRVFELWMVKMSYLQGMSFRVILEVEFANFLFMLR